MNPVALIGGPADGGSVALGTLPAGQWALVVGGVVVAMSEKSERLLDACRSCSRRYLYQYDADNERFVYVGALPEAVKA